MRYPVIVSVNLIVVMILLLFYAEVRYEFSGHSEYKKVADFWHEQYYKEKLNRQLLADQMEDFRQNVAVLIPDAVEKTKDEYQKMKIRGLASVIQNSSVDKPIDVWTSERYISLARTLFKEKKYNDLNKVLLKIIEKYPDSAHVVESYYLTVESHFQKQDMAECARWVEKMVNQFPDNILTGYSLFRLGQIFEIQSRYQDALEIYKTISVTYHHDKELTESSQKAIREIQL